MGCASSTHVVTDPHTGQKKTQNKLGGAYPGNRRQPNSPYAPPASQFQNGQATAHFVNYGGGNALVLQQGGVAQPQVGATPTAAGQPDRYVQVTLPAGVYGGQTIQVAAPDGRLNEIVVPAGFGPGSTFTVEFADGPAPGGGAKYETPAPSSYGTSATTTTTRPPYVPYVNNNNNNNRKKMTSHNPTPATAPPASLADDGFATGFNNPNFVPSAPATSIGNAADYSSYPTADDAKPVYSQPPRYTSKPY